MAVAGWRDDDPASGHALADVIVGIAFEIHIETPRIPDTEALSGGAAEVQRDGGVRHALVTVKTRDFTGQTCAYRAMRIVNLVFEFTTAGIFNRVDTIGHHLLGELGLIPGWIALLDAVLW